MTLDNLIATSQKIMRVLKLRSMIYPIAKTDKGDLGIKIYSDKDTHEIVLDAVPLSDGDFDVKQIKKFITQQFFASVE